VEFSDTTSVGDFCGLNLEWFDFAGRVIADLTSSDTQLAAWLLSRGARHAYVCNIDVPQSLSDRIETWSGDFWNFPFGSIDYVFFDPRRVQGFDFVQDAIRGVERISSMLTPDGSCFIVLRSGPVQTDWDVFNASVLTPVGRLPSSPYLYGSILGDFAVRPLLRLQEDIPQCVTRIFRVSRRKPSLLLIVGHSQSGKTTLARSLLRSRPGTHVSSDYVYFNLFQMRNHIQNGMEVRRLSTLLGEATAEDTGNFFRSLETDEASLAEYLDLVCQLLPPNEDLVSFDIDLREPGSVNFARSYLESLGFMVWVVSR
jgi:hypothetical protein